MALSSPRSDPDKSSLGIFFTYARKKNSLRMLVECEQNCRQLQDQVSVLEREVPRLEDRLQKRRNEASLSAAALKKCIGARDDLQVDIDMLNDNYKELGITPEDADRKIDALFSEFASLKEDGEILKINLQKTKAEVMRCNEEKRSLLKLLGK